MQYKVINSSIIIAYIQNKYSVDNTYWLSSAPFWIYLAVEDIGCHPFIKSEMSEDVSVEDYKAILPCDLKLLDAIIYENYRLPKMGKPIGRQASMVPYTDHPSHSYELRGDNYIITTFETGTINYIYRKLPIEQDDKTGLWYPLIPDKEPVKEAIEKYILYLILQKGYPVKGFSLKEVNPATNPYLAYFGDTNRGIRSLRKVARNSLINIDSDTRKILSDMTRTFIYDYNKVQSDYSQNVIQDY